MSLKQKLEQLRNELSKNQTKRDIDLDVKINNFINWYLKNMVNKLDCKPYIIVERFSMQKRF